MPSDEDDKLLAGLLRFFSSPEGVGVQLNRDLQTQLFTIKNLLRHLQKAEEESRLEFEREWNAAEQATYEPGSWEESMKDGGWSNVLHESGYQSAAHSMVAAAMFAPFVEMLFVRIFRRIQDEQETGPRAALDEKRSQASEKIFWNPHWYFPTKEPPREDLAAGIKQLADCTGLAKHLPNDYHKTVEALILYRNKMFHNGLEWPKVECKKFQEMMKSKKWPKTWFILANLTADSQMFTMETQFVEHCFHIIEKVVKGFGEFQHQASS